MNLQPYLSTSYIPLLNHQSMYSTLACTSFELTSFIAHFHSRLLVTRQHIETLCRARHQFSYSDDDHRQPHHASAPRYSPCYNFTISNMEQEKGKVERRGGRKAHKGEGEFRRLLQIGRGKSLINKRRRARVNLES